MYAFDYHAAKSVSDAIDRFNTLGDAAFLSGGHTLLPTMKNRLAAPEHLIDVSGLPELQGIDLADGVLRIGAGTTHATVAASDVVRDAIPALALLAGSIGDAQVRHLGTIGGSVANNDPSADYPAAVLGLDAIVETDRRRIDADDYFDGLYATALEEGELVVALHFPLPDRAGYGKYRNPASRYALAGSFVARTGQGIRVAVTGAGQDGVFRWSEAERALADRFDAEALQGLYPEASGLLGDMHAAPDFRANLVNVVTRRAVGCQGSAAII